MVPSGSWRDHFKIDDNILKAFWDEFSESSPLRASELTLETASSTTEFVLWCVRERHFTEQEFIEHQSVQFDLPHIRADFFSTPIDQPFWDRVKDLHPWTSSCFPLAEWEGHLLIGSVWPNPDFHISVPHSFVLGTPSGLHTFFSRFTAAIETPIEKAKPVAAVAPTVEAKQPAPKVAAEIAAKVDSGDPFAALSRELGLLNDEPSEAASSTETPLEAEAPEGFVMPEGLSFSKEEAERLGLGQPEKVEAPLEESNDASSDSQVDFETDQAPEGFASVLTAPPAPEVLPEVSEGGTLVHNFETGDQEVVQRKTEHSLNLQATEAAPSPILGEAPAAELEFASLDLMSESESAPALHLTPLAPRAPEAAARSTPKVVMAPAAPPETPSGELDVTQPSIAKYDLPPPVLPFAPIVTPESPAMVKPPAPPLFAKPLGPQAARTSAPAAPSPNAKAFEPESPAKPVAEATIVVSAEVEPPKRKPLFEPAGGDSALPKTAISDRMREMAAKKSATQSGTQTGTKGKKLEGSPVTGFFQIMGGKSSGRVRNEAYTKHAISISKVEPVHLDQCTSIDEAGAQALLQASNIFETAMILLFKDGGLQPWKWSDLFLSVNGEKPEPIELKDPSIFKIVFRTAKPYHGYVVTSQTNQKFFNEFYRGMLPKHATVIPIMIDNRMGGMLLAFTNSKIEYRQSLRLMERLSYDLSRTFKMLRAQQAKAS